MYQVASAFTLKVSAKLPSKVQSGTLLRSCLDCDGGLCLCAFEHKWWSVLILLPHILGLIHENEGHVSNTGILLFESVSQPLCVDLVACGVDESWNDYIRIGLQILDHGAQIHHHFIPLCKTVTGGLKQWTFSFDSMLPLWAACTP